jgi:cell division protein FtsI/penicillin-binding protein 2
MYNRKIKLRPLTPYEKKRAENRLKQAKRLNLFLLFVVIIGFILILRYLLGHSIKSVVTINFSDQKGTLGEWVQSGFVRSIDDSTGTLVLNEALWNQLSTPQKESVVILFRGFFARKRGTKESKLIIKGDISRQLLVSTEVVSISSKLEHPNNK